MIDMIKSIYTGRQFIVPEGNGQSSVKPHHFGISQGCPSCSFLFIMMMAILIQGARRLLEQHVRKRADLVHDIAYADDIMIFDEDRDIAEQYMNFIASLQ